MPWIQHYESQRALGINPVFTRETLPELTDGTEPDVWLPEQREDQDAGAARLSWPSSWALHPLL